MRPLYIEGSVGCRVVFDDPALRVVVTDKADQLFPLSRVSRVVCSGVVDWSMSALLACADAGVNVLFLAKNGELRGRWLGQSQQRQLLAQRLVDLLARPDGLGRYENWYLAVE
jgi:CRISPR/Cas system-associated endonuclease Cas1